MIAWIITLSAIFNFTFGAMLPLIPRLSLEKAGLAFTAFYLFKVLCFAPAGVLSDKIGHGRGMTVAIIFQVIAIGSLLGFPDNPWIGRIFEGIALAQGTVSAISSLRIHCTTPALFEKSIKQMMSFSGVGFVLGPLTAYALLQYDVKVALYVLFAVVLVAFAIHLAFFQYKGSELPPVVQETFDKEASRGSLSVDSAIWTGIGLASAKAVAVGWQPTAAWWATEVLHLSPLLSGMTFVAMGLALAIGSAKPKPLFYLTGAFGFLFMEIALRSTPALWWAALTLTGYWWGSYLSFAYAKLGWDDPKMIGKHNSKWMFLTDVPTALVPIVVWNWRMPDSGLVRPALGATLVAVSILGYFLGFRPKAEPQAVPLTLQ